MSRVTIRLAPISALLIGVFFLMAAEVVAQSSWSSKLDAGATALVRADAEQLSSFSSVILPNLAVDADDSGRRYADLFVRVDDPSAAGQVEAAGMDVRTVAGSILVGRAPVTAIPAIAEVQAVRSISVSRIAHRMNDAANAITGVDLVHAGTGLPQGYDGTGVIVGVVDTGIDITHPAFQHENGETRILWLAEAHPEGLYIWNHQQINSAPESVSQIDSDGHGTHVAGTAAGGPRPASEFVGVAPEADLVIVKADRFGGGFSDADVVHAVNFVCTVAALHERPAVVNLSLGGNGGPLDGSSDYEQALTSLADTGCIIVAAAGNEGFYNAHVGYDAVVGQSREMIVESVVDPSINPDNPEDFSELIILDLWFDEDALSELTFVLYGPGGGGTEEISVTAPVTIDLDDPEGFEMSFEAGTEVLGGVAAYSLVRDPNTEDGHLVLLIYSVPGVDLSAGAGYAFGMRNTSGGSGRVDAWLPRAGMQEFLVDPPFGQNVVNGSTLSTIGSPASAHDVIAVAAFNSKNSWVDINGQTQTATDWSTGEQAEVGARAFFSSTGPTRDGRLGIDISAPGNILASAHSGDSNVSADRLVGGGLFSMKEGTSMASPHVSGIIALMLQINPELSEQDVIHILHETALRDGFTGTDPSVEWGHGKVDAFAAIQAALFTVGTEGQISDLIGLSLEAPYPNPSRGRTAFAFNLPRAGEASLVVYDILGRRVQVAVEGELAAGPHRATVDLAGLASGTYVARLATEDGHSVARRFTVVR